jgi:phosphocarrier protein
MPEREVKIGSRVGLHARPAKLFVEAATAAPVPVKISKGDGKPVDARSILGVLALGAKNGDAVRLQAEGEGADEILDSLVDLLQQDLDDPAPADA